MRRITILIIAGEIDLSFPSIMAIGVVAYVLAFDAAGIVANLHVSYF